jgi:hypothetical protein
VARSIGRTLLGWAVVAVGVGLFFVWKPLGVVVFILGLVTLAVIGGTGANAASLGDIGDGD